MSKVLDEVGVLTHGKVPAGVLLTKEFRKKFHVYLGYLYVQKMRYAWDTRRFATADTRYRGYA